MSTAPTTMKKPPPPPVAKGASSPTAIASGPVAVSRGKVNAVKKIGIYGTGAIGKSSLVASIEKIGKKPLFIDLDEGSNELDVARVHANTWDELLSILRNQPLWSDFDTVVIDTATKAEEICGTWVIQNIPDKKGQKVKRLAEFGFGDDANHIYEAFLHLFAELDAHYRAGRNIIIIMHECISEAPNPSGEDFIRYEPRMLSPKKGKNSLRHKIKEWVDHLFFIAYDLHVNKEGKAAGGGSRTIYPTERPTHLAKSRSLSEEIVYERDSAELWKQLFNVETV